MTVLITAVGLVVAIAAGVRSTWSPCGRSMLSTITPIGERGRGNRFAVTAAWFIAGGVAGGLCLGSLGAVLAVAVGSGHLRPVTVGSLAAAATFAGAVFDAGPGGLRLPVHRRQVNERWLDRFRSGVYGFGFGWQIGSGLATYIMTAGVYLVLVLGALSGDPWAALSMGVALGSVRGLAVLLGRHIRTPALLATFHRRFDGLGEWSRRGMVVLEAAAAVVIAGALWPPAVLVAAVALAGAGAAFVLRIRRAPAPIPPTARERPGGL